MKPSECSICKAAIRAGVTGFTSLERNDFLLGIAAGNRPEWLVRLFAEHDKGHLQEQSKGAAG